ncbi:MAG: class I adenylate cyclase [Humidesulfovibrio sp.]|nr:class I adenylate cyclase [Humidesulfovibrio sp.]
MTENLLPDALRQILRVGQADALKARPEVLAGAAAARAKARHPGEPASRAGEWVFLLAQALREQPEPGLSAKLLQLLVESGRLGRTLACLHFQSRTVPLPQLTPLLQTLSGRNFLTLLNTMLLDAPSEDKQFTAWLRTLLPAPGRVDPREALLFLKALADQCPGCRPPVALPLRDALLDAGLDTALAKALRGSPGAATGEILFQAAECLAVPSVQEAALAYALRTAGGSGTSRLGPLLAAPPDLDSRDTALATEMRRLALGTSAPQQLLGAAQTEPETLGLVLADLIRSGGAQEAAGLRLLPLLPRLGALSCLNDLPEQARQAAYTRLLEYIVALDPEFLSRAAKCLGVDLGGPSANAVASLLTAPLAVRTASHSASPYNLQAWKSAAHLRTGPDAAQQKSAKGRNNALGEVARHDTAQVKGQDYSHSHLPGGVLDGQTFSACNLSRCRFSDVSFRRVRFTGVFAAQCVFENCVFEDCVFTSADFCHSLLRDCRFESCSFEGCDLSRARLSGCVFNGGNLAESCLAGAALTKTRVEAVSFRTCALNGMRLQECFLTRLVFTRSDLCGSLWEKCCCRDSEWRSCTLSAMRLLDCECLGLVLSRPARAGLEFLGGHTDNPHLAQAERATRARLLDGILAAPLSLDPALRDGAGAAFARACVDTFLRVDEAQGTLNAMRGQDQRRRKLACARLTEDQGRFLSLLPTLLCTDLFERAHNIPDVPACVISGRARSETPPRETLELLERLFPGHTPPQEADPLLVIEALYTIGSLGSVAQKPSSDVDCWVCLSVPPGTSPDVAEEARIGFGHKLAALETWAWEQFGLETHFFPMDMADVRQNNFGMSDKESSGSAQATLLKEEFYRTALKLAGRDLLWWAAPPEASQAEAGTLLADLARFVPRTAAELVDLGQPSAIPPEEYFGACLWQIVKALHSPYKSVMKLGLLEKYADQGQDMRLLCDRIKEAVLRGRKLTADVDPYLSLFTSIRKHYRLLSDSTSLAIIGECLRLKADVAPEDLPSEFENTDSEPEAQAAPETDTGTFTAALRLGGMVSQFMVQAYLRIQEGIRAGGSAAHITPQDLTRLGRRIAANFSQQPHKVGLVPFLSDDMTFSELSFYAEKAPGKRTIWAVKGKDKASGKVAVESLAPIRRDTDVARLLAWLLFNGLYAPAPKQVVLAEKTFAPIALLDLQNLLADMAAFFPRRATLEPDLDEYLEHERVVRCYLIVNLPVSPDQSKILTISAIYATNWGEVFCQSFDNPPPLLLKSPAGFLQMVLSKNTPSGFELRIFTPKRAACPRLKAI